MATSNQDNKRSGRFAKELYYSTRDSKARETTAGRARDIPKDRMDTGKVKEAADRQRDKIKSQRLQTIQQKAVPSEEKIRQVIRDYAVKRTQTGAGTARKKMTK